MKNRIILLTVLALLAGTLAAEVTWQFTGATNRVAAASVTVEAPSVRTTAANSATTDRADDLETFVWTSVRLDGQNLKNGPLGLTIIIR